MNDIQTSLIDYRVPSENVPETISESLDSDERKLLIDQVRELLIKENAYLYVCGDGAKMAKDVEKALVEIFCQQGDMSIKDAKEKLELLKKQRRYVKDVWS